MENPSVEQKIFRRLSDLETHVINLIYPIQQLLSLLGTEEFKTNLHSILKCEQEIKSVIQKSMNEIFKTAEHIESLNPVQSSLEIKYLGNRLKEIESILHELQRDGVKRKITCKINLDGFEEESEIKKEKKLEHNLMIVLNKLDEDEKRYLIKKYGFFTGKKSTYKEMAASFGCSIQSATILHHKILRKLRHNKYMTYLQDLDDDKYRELIKDILG